MRNARHNVRLLFINFFQRCIHNLLVHHASEVGINDSVTEPPQAGKYLDSRVEDQDVSSRTSQAESMLQVSLSFLS